MKSAIEIANKFVVKAEKERSLFSNMKLQKLLYIANGINLALYAEPLFTEHIEAWPYGPVVPVVYHSYKFFGNSNIVTGVFGHYDLNVDLDAKAQRSIDDTWRIAKDIDPIKLSNWTHNPDSPWSKAKSESLSVIPDEYMQDFFKKFAAQVNLANG